MRPILVLFALCGLAFGQASQKGQPDMNSSGNRFLAICGDARDTTPPLTEVGVMCMLYVVGLTNGIAMFADKGSVYEMYCSPGGVTNGQAIQMLVKYAKDHPEKLHQETRLLMLGALVEGFPCPPKKQDKVPDATPPKK
jgi:Rap1a immunity proteins